MGAPVLHKFATNLDKDEAKIIFEKKDQNDWHPQAPILNIFCQKSVWKICQTTKVSVWLSITFWPLRTSQFTQKSDFKPCEITIREILSEKLVKTRVRPALDPIAGLLQAGGKGGYVPATPPPSL